MSLKFYAETNLPTRFGLLRFRTYRDEAMNEPMAIVTGFIDTRAPVNLRIHSSCITSEVFASCKCDCKQQLDHALDYIHEHSGLIIYLHQEGRGIGIGDKIRAYALQEQGYDTIEANEMLDLPIDARCYKDAVDILHELGISSVNLLTNNPQKVNALESAGVQVKERISALVPANSHSNAYLATKRIKMGHFL